MTLQTFGRYEIKEQLGRGGMASVFRAYDPRFKRDVAIKVLPRELLLDDPQFRARFEREAETIAALEHPAIVPVYDFGEEEGQPYLVMRLMTGGSLADRISQGPLPAAEAARILRRIGAALDRAHEHGVVHRDLKPGNILFDQYGEAFLADFGIVRLKQAGGTLTATGGIVGTPAYMSPEQIQGKQLDGRTDIYALGIIVFEMLTGKKPYEADTPAMMLVKQITEPMPRVLEVNPNLPPGCEYVITRATAKEADGRFDKAGEMAETLASALQGQEFELPATQPAATPPTVSSPPVAEPTDVPAAPPPETPAASRRVPVWVWVGAGLLLLCLCGSLVMANRLGQQIEMVFARLNGSNGTTPITREPITETRPFATPLPTVLMGDTAVTPIAPQDSSQMEALQRLGRGTVNAVALSEDGQRLALGSSVGIWIYDAHTLEPLQLLTGHNGLVSAVAWSPDGERVASASWDTTVRIWDVAAGEQQRLIQGNDQYIAVAWSPDGSTIAATTWGSPIELYDQRNGEKVGELVGHESSITRLAWSPQAGLLASADNGENATIRLWDVAAQLETAVLDGHTGEIANLTWSPAGSQLISSGFDSTARVWGADGTEQLVLSGHEYGVYDAAWSPDGERILTTGGDNTQRVWDAADGGQVRALPIEESPAIRLIWLEDTNQIVEFLADGTIVQVDAASETIVNTLHDHTAGVWSVAWSPNSQLLATGGHDGTVRLWRTDTGEQAALLDAHDYAVSAVSFSPDGNFLASAGEDSFLRVWDVSQQLKVGEWSNPNFGGLSSVVYAPRSPWLAVADWGGHVWLLDATDLTVLADWQTFDEGLGVTQVAWSVDEKLLAISGQDTAVQLWQVSESSGNLTEPVLFNELPGHGDIVTDVSWSPEASHVATGSHDQQLRLWQVAEGPAAEGIAAEGQEVWQQDLRDLVMSVAWSPNGVMLAAARYDGLVQLFIPSNGQELHQLPGHVGSVDSLAWSHDSARLASGSADGTVIIWGIIP